MNATELRALSETDLREHVEGLREEAFNLRVQQATGQVEDTSRIRVVRRELARALTIGRERELWSEYEASVAAKPRGEPQARNKGRGQKE
jgi:large subunit ribosomal protein L29